MIWDVFRFGAFRAAWMDIRVRRQDIRNGWAPTKCPDCNGTGEFLLPDDTPVECVACKTSGLMYVNV